METISPIFPSPIKTITVADDLAAGKISFETVPLEVVPVVTQKLSATPLCVSGILCLAAIPLKEEIPGITSVSIFAFWAISSSSFALPNTKTSPPFNLTTRSP